MSTPHDQIAVPRPIVLGLIALGLFTVVSAGFARATQVGVTREAPSPVAVRQVTFHVAMQMQGSSAIVATLAGGRHIRLAGEGEEIFPRLILQGVANLRQRAGVSQSAPLLLVVAQDGERLLVDPVLHHVVRLAAFGRENGGAFDALLA